MKRNNILSYILFILSALFPVLFGIHHLFLSGYIVLFDGLIICADIRNIVMIGICAAMLIFRDKRVGRVAKALLVLSVMLLPVSRLLMIWFTEAYPGTWDSVIYLFVVVIMIVTVWMYIKVNWLMTVEVIIFSVLMGICVLYSTFALLFSYGKIGDVADISSTDGIHHVRVVEYEDDDVKDRHIKAVYAYNSAESFSIGPIEFMKDWHLIDECDDIDTDSQIAFQDNGTVTVQDRTFTYDGARVTD